MPARHAARDLTELREALRSLRVSLRSRRRVGALDAVLLRASGPSAALATLHFPRWAEEWCGQRLTRAERTQLQAVQAHLLAWIVLRDGIADGDSGTLGNLPDLMPLLFEAQHRLGLLFGPGDPFWGDYRCLVRQQVGADRWERAPPVHARFNHILVTRLGRKAALLRWPAGAVARRLCRPSSVKEIDSAFDDLLAALQLFDDILDVEEDAAAGQVNAVLVAGGAVGSIDPMRLQEHIEAGISPVYTAARSRLLRLTRCRGGIGAFSRSLLAGSVDGERRALEVARNRRAGAFLAQLLARPQ